MASRLTVYTDDTNDTLQMRRNIASALRHLGVADADSERVLAFFASDIQRIAVPPPLLPPRPSDWDAEDMEPSEAGTSRMVTARSSPIPDLLAEELDAETCHIPRARSYVPPFVTSDDDCSSDSERRNSADSISPPDQNTQNETPAPAAIEIEPDSPPVVSKSPLGPNVRFLLVADKHVNFVMVAQAYLELLRAKVASQRGFWMFYSVHSVLMDSSIVYDPDRNNCSSIVRQVQYEARQYGYDGLLLTDPISEALFQSNRKFLSMDAIWDYDYILIWDRSQVDELKRLKGEASRYQKKIPRARILLLPGVDMTSTYQVREIVTPMCNQVMRFLERYFDWTAPNFQSTGPSITAFVQITLKDVALRFIENSDRNTVVQMIQDSFDWIECASGCTLHMSHHASPKKLQTVALVGSWDHCLMAKKHLHDILWEKNFGHAEGPLWLDEISMRDWKKHF